MALVKVRPTGIRLQDDFTFTGTVDGIKSGGGYKNMFCNNGFRIWQRATDSGNVTNNGFFSCDNVYQKCYLNGTWQNYQSTDVPANVPGLMYSIALKCITAGTHSLRASTLEFRMEGSTVQPKLHYGTSNAQTSVVSFWIKSNVAGSHTCQVDNTKGLKSFIQVFTINSADTWERKEIVVPGDTTVGDEYTDEHARQCIITINANLGSLYKSGTSSNSWESTSTVNKGVGHTSTFGDTANDELKIAGLQYEVGSSVTDVEILDYPEVLKRCQRYYYTFGDYGTGDVTTNRFYSSHHSTSGSFIHIDYPVTMSKNPTLYYTASGGATSTNYSNKTHVQLFDSDDTSWRVYDIRAEAQI